MPCCSECGSILTEHQCVKVKKLSGNKDAQKERIFCVQCFKVWEPEVTVPQNSSSFIDPLTLDVAIKTEAEIKTELEEDELEIVENLEESLRKRNLDQVSYNESPDKDDKSLDNGDEEVIDSKESLHSEEDSIESEYDEEWLDDTADNVDAIERSGEHLGHMDKCDWCMRNLRKLRYRNLPENLPERTAIMFHGSYRRERSPERLCTSCFDKAHKWAEYMNRETNIKTRNITKSSEVKDAKEITNPINAFDTNMYSYSQSIKLPGYQKASRRSKRCFIPSCENKLERRLIVPKYLRKVLLELYKVYVSQSAVCEEHLKEYYRDWSFLKKENFNEEFTAYDVEGMLDLLRNDILCAPE